MAITYSTMAAATAEVVQKIQNNRRSLKQAQQLTLNATNELTAMATQYAEIGDAVVAQAPNDPAVALILTQLTALSGEYTALAAIASAMNDDIASVEL